MRNQRTHDIFIVCTDNLTSFSAVINVVFSKTDVKSCIVYHPRTFSKHVSYKDIKKLMADLKAIYASSDEQAPLSALREFENAWEKMHPKIASSRREN